MRAADPRISYVCQFFVSLKGKNGAILFKTQFAYSTVQKSWAAPVSSPWRKTFFDILKELSVKFECFFKTCVAYSNIFTSVSCIWQHNVLFFLLNRWILIQESLKQRLNQCCGHQIGVKKKSNLSSIFRHRVCFWYLVTKVKFVQTPCIYEKWKNSDSQRRISRKDSIVGVESVGRFSLFFFFRKCF